MNRLSLLFAAFLTSVSLGSIAFSLGAFGEASYTPEAKRCGKDISAMYAFWQAHIANTPNPQLTLETGLYVRRDGGLETYADLLHREAGYEVTWC